MEEEKGKFSSPSLPPHPPSVPFRQEKEEGRESKPICFLSSSVMQALLPTHPLLACRRHNCTVHTTTSLSHPGLFRPSLLRWLTHRHSPQPRKVCHRCSLRDEAAKHIVLLSLCCLLNHSILYLSRVCILDSPSVPPFLPRLALI